MKCAGCDHEYSSTDWWKCPECNLPGPHMKKSLDAQAKAKAKRAAKNDGPESLRELLRF